MPEIIPVSFEVCPSCKGLARAPNTGIVGFDVCLDPQYVHMPAGQIWHKEFYVCAACLGTGKLADALARRLSGEYSPDVRLTPDPGYPSHDYKGL